MWKYKKLLPILTKEPEEGRNSTQLQQQPFSCPASAGKAFLGGPARTQFKKPDIKAFAVPISVTHTTRNQPPEHILRARSLNASLKMALPTSTGPKIVNGTIIVRDQPEEEMRTDGSNPKTTDQTIIEINMEPTLENILAAMQDVQEALSHKMLRAEQKTDAHSKMA